jgi:hypothetical protein
VSTATDKLEADRAKAGVGGKNADADPIKARKGALSRTMEEVNFMFDLLLRKF